MDRKSFQRHGVPNVPRPGILAPEPRIFYEVGGGPMFDMGPVKEVSGVTTRAFEERIATCNTIYTK